MLRFRRRGAHTRGPFYGVRTLVALCLLGPPALARLLGAWRVPFADDWAYLRIAEAYVRLGTVRFVGWNDIALLGELPVARALAVAFGDHYSTYRLISVGASFVIVFVHLKLQRALGLGEWAWVGTLLLVVWPGFLSSSVTMMTDLPALAGQLISLLLVVRANSRERFRQFRFLSAVAVAFTAVTIRQNAVVALITVIVIGLASRPLRRSAVIAIPAVVAGWLVFFARRGSIPDAGSVRISLSVAGPILDLVSSFFLFGLISAPLALQVLAGRRGAPTLRSLRHNLPMVVSSLAVAAALAVMVVSGREPLLGNTLTPSGPLGEAVLSGSKPALFPLPIWWCLGLMGAVGTVGGLAGAFACGRRWLKTVDAGFAGSRVIDWAQQKPGEATLTLFAALSLALFVGWSFSPPAFDRYLFGFVSAAIPLLIRVLHLHPVRRIATSVLVCLVALVVLAFGSVWDAYSYSTARWKLGERFVALGGQATSVDAGFEWVGAHYRGIAKPNLLGERASDDGLPQNDYLGVFPDFVRRAVVITEDTSDPRLCLLQTTSYSQWFGLRRRPMYLYVLPDGDVVNDELIWPCDAQIKG